jgi:RNase P subunit RPR2
MVAVCNYDECNRRGTVVSRLSPEGFLVSSGKKAYSFREAYERFHYCKECHEMLMKEVWSRVRSSGDKDDDHVAPTAV